MRRNLELTTLVTHTSNLGHVAIRPKPSPYSYLATLFHPVIVVVLSCVPKSVLALN
jgi:hypothetical protein